MEDAALAQSCVLSKTTGSIEIGFIFTSTNQKKQKKKIGSNSSRHNHFQIAQLFVDIVILIVSTYFDPISL